MHFGQLGLSTMLISRMTTDAHEEMFHLVGCLVLVHTGKGVQLDVPEMVLHSQVADLVQRLEQTLRLLERAEGDDDPVHWRSGHLERVNQL